MFALLQIFYEFDVAWPFIELHRFDSFGECHEVFREDFFKIVNFLDGCTTHELIIFISENIKIFYQTLRKFLDRT